MPLAFVKSANRLTAIDIEAPEGIEKDSILEWLSFDAINYKRPDTGFVTYGAVEYNDETGNNFDIIIAPNPTEKDFFIIFDNPQKQKIMIDLIDLEGKFIENICDGILSAGWQTYKVDTKLLASATYFVKMIFNDKIIVRRVIVNK